MKKQSIPYTCATNGLEAFETFCAGTERFFLIIMDLNMPVMDGFESTAKIRGFERKRKLRKTHIAALTGMTDPDARKSAMEAGVDKYLTKPTRMKDLKALVAEITEEDSS